MRKLYSIAVAAALVAFPGLAFAANQQADSDSYRKGQPRDPFYGRSDGLYYTKDSKVPTLIGNGDGYFPLGPTYTENFDYGDGLGLLALEFDGTAYSATAAAVNVLQFGEGVKLLHVPFVGQTLPPDMDASSLDIGSDQTDNDGLEIYGGQMSASGRAFVVGDDPAFKFCATVAVADVSGTDEFHIGFRAAGVANATFDNYTDLASIGPVSGNITIETILNNAATVTTDTTDDAADGTAVAYCVLVSDTGAVTYTIDGGAPSATAAFTFDDGEMVVPFIHFLQASDLTGEVDVTLWEVTYQ